MGAMKRIRLGLLWMSKSLVYGIFVIPESFYYCILRCVLAWKIHRLEASRAECEDEDSLVLARSIVSNPSKSENLDFKLHRSKAYLNRVTFGRLIETAKLAGGEQKIPLVSCFMLRFVLLNSMFSYGLIRECKPDSEVLWRFSFNDIKRYAVLRKFSWDVDEILVLKSGYVTIVDRNGTEHGMNSKTWPLAKAHAQVQLSLLAPGIIHNVDHLVLSSVIAEEVNRTLPENSTLRLLLEAHTRFARVINDIESKDIFNSTASKNGLGCLMSPWINAPADTQHALEQISRKCDKYFAQKSSLLPELDDDIPYQSFLKDYYKVFRNFVTALTPYLEGDYELLRKAIAKNYPGLAELDMVEVVSVFLWNCSIVHTADHTSYLQKWGWQYGCMAIRKPLVKKLKNGHTVSIRTVSDDTNDEILSSIDMKESQKTEVAVNIQSHPSLEEDGLYFFRSCDVFRTRCFLRTYVQYNATPSVDMALYNTDYGFSDPAAVAIAEKFLTDIKDLSSMLKQRGEDIVKGHEIIRSVCF